MRESRSRRTKRAQEIRVLIFASRSGEIAIRFPTDEEVRDAASSALFPGSLKYNKRCESLCINEPVIPRSEVVRFRVIQRSDFAIDAEAIS
jgi:hypothetical protein